MAYLSLFFFVSRCHRSELRYESIAQTTDSILQNLNELAFQINEIVSRQKMNYGNEQVLYDRIVIPQEWESEVNERKIEPDKTMLISVAATFARIFSNFNIFSSSDTLTVRLTFFKFKK